MGYFDPQDRIVLKDLQGVLDWYRSVGMIKTPMKASSLLDERFVTFAKLRRREITRAHRLAGRRARALSGGYGASHVNLFLRFVDYLSSRAKRESHAIVSNCGNLP